MRTTTERGIDDATVSASEVREQDRVDDIEEVEGAMERGGAVHVP